MNFIGNKMVKASQNPESSKLFSFLDQAFLVSLCLLWAGVSFSLALVSIGTVLTLLFWGARMYFQKQGCSAFKTMPRELKFSLGIFLALSLASVFWSEFPKQSVQGIFKIIRWTLIMFATADGLSDTKHRRHFLIVLISWHTIIILNGLYQYGFHTDLLRHIAAEDSESGIRVTSSFKVYGLFAAYLLLVIPVLVGIFIRFLKKFPYNLVALVILLLSGFMLYVTRCRGAMLAFLLGTFIFLILKRQLKVMGFLVFFSAVGLFLLPSSMKIHYDKERKEQSLVERHDLWERALDVIRAKPLLGTGINTYAVAHQKYDRNKSWRVQNYYAHNGYLQMAAETGIPCALFFLAFLSLLLKYVLRGASYSTDSFYVGWGILNFMLMALVDTILHNSVTIVAFYFFLGLGLSFLNSPSHTDQRT
ncbi:MAG: O-antigen ligase family protein [Candidatus Omnitrophica bacterium]|nr:O-antigen ligase family protein [Candidatus Omnitrophota bacterium]